MTRLGTGLLGSLVVLALAASAHAQTIKLGQAMVFHIPDLKPGADLKAFEAYVTKQAAGWAKSSPGTVLTLVKKDRGPHAGDGCGRPDEQVLTGVRSAVLLHERQHGAWRALGPAGGLLRHVRLEGFQIGPRLEIRDVKHHGLSELDGLRVGIGSERQHQE